MKKKLLVKLVVLLLTAVTLSGCLLVPVGIRHNHGGGHDRGHHDHGGRHGGHDRD